MVTIARRNRTDLAAIAFLTLLFVGIFSDVLFGQRDFFIRDLTRYYHPTKSLLREIVLSGEFPWWNPYYSAGQPMAANPEYEVFYPFQWLILFPDFETGYRLHILLHVWITAVGMYLFLRSMRRSASASIFGAISWGFGGVTLSLINLLPILFAAAWLPLVLLFARRVIRRFTLRDAALASLFGGMQILVGEPTTLMQTWLIIGFYALWRMFRLRSRGVRAMIDPVSIVTLILAWSIAIGAVQLIPAIDHAGETSRARGFDYELITAWSFPPQRIVELVYPHVFGRMDAEGRTVWWGGSGLYGRPASPFFFSIYLGGAMFAMIAAGLAIRHTRRWPVILFAAVFVLVALGRHIVVYRWLVDAGLSIPFRYPEKFVLSALFGLVVFGTVMFDRIRDGDRRLSRVAALVCGVVCLVAVAIAMSSVMPLYDEAFTKLWGVSGSRFHGLMISVSARDWVVAGLINGLAALLFWLRSRGSIPLAWAWGMTVLLVIDLIPVGFDASPRIQRSFYATPEVVEDLPAGTDYRVFHEVDWYGRSDKARTWFSTGRGVYWVVRNGLYPMTGGNHGIRTVLERDYDRTALLPTVDLARAMWEVRDAGQKQWAAIFMEMSNAGFRSRYRERDRELQRVGGDFRHVRPVDFTEVPLAPRYYLAERLVEIDGRSDFVDELVKKAPDPRTAFVSFEPFPPAAGSVSVVSEKSSTIELDVATEGRSFLVLSVTPHRYWSAEVDGRKTELQTVNIGYQGLELDAGEHRVVMRYRNPVILGSVPFTAAGLILSLVGTCLPRRRRHDPGGFRDGRAAEPASDPDRIGEHARGVSSDRHA